MKRSTIISKEQSGICISISGKHLFLSAVFITLCLINLSGQKKITATGTGNTTGHIATLTVTNSSSSPLNINQQIAYIPSDGKYQPYVGSIPETTIPPNSTTDIPVKGYCADVTTPPVPNGTNMPPIDTWIPVGTTTETNPLSTNLLPKTSLPPFTPGDIPGITHTPGFNSSPPEPDDNIIATWPNTDIPVGGTIDPKTYPEVFAPVIIEVLKQIEEGAAEILKEDDYPTPFSNDPEKERESVIQQTFWIFMADVTGKEYTKPVFTDRVYNQFEDATGKAVTKLPDEQKEKVDDGITEFWNAFTAVGVDAKVLADPSKKAQVPYDPSDADQLTGNPDEPPVLIKDEKVVKQCECGKVTFELYLWDTKEVAPNKWDGVQENLHKSTVEAEPGTSEHEVIAAKKKTAKGSKQLVQLKNIQPKCHCISITDEIADVMEALAKLEKANLDKLNKAKTDLQKAETDLKKENEKRKPNKITIDRLTSTIEKLKTKISELEDPITAKQNELTRLKKEAADGDCPVYADDTKKVIGPDIKVKSDNTDITGKWGDTPLQYDYTFMLTRGDKPIEFRIEISYYCQDNQCKPVQCKRTIVIKVEEK